LAKVEAGQCYVVRAAWNQDFIHELEQFPVGRFDDQVDAVSVLWEVVRKRQVLCVA
jgi:predicted phage terminase large subunit-like protein